MDHLTWKTARIRGHPDGDIFAVISADHFDNSDSAFSTIVAADTLMSQDLPLGGLVAEYLFLDQLEREALASQIAENEAQRVYLRCSTTLYSLPAARARLEAIKIRFLSDAMAELERLKLALDAEAQARGASTLGQGEAYLAMQQACNRLATPKPHLDIYLEGHP